MNHKMRIFQVVSVLLFIGIMSMFFSCAPKDPAVIAGKVAKEWSANNVDNVSSSIGDLIAGDNPLIKIAMVTVIKNEIKQRIAWEYSEPRKLGEDQYEVIATAYSGVEVPLLGSYKVSLDYNLKIDTGRKQVISADMDASSFALSQQ